MQGRLKTLNVSAGQAKLEQGGQYTYDLTTVKDLLGFGTAYPYLRQLLWKYQFTLTNSTSSAITVNWPVLYGVLTGCYFQLTSFNRTVFALTLSAGQTLWILSYLRNRCLPVVQTDLVVPGSGTSGGVSAVVNLMVPIDFFDLRSREPEDEMIYTQFLDGSTIQFTWAPNTAGVGPFGASLTVTSVTAATLTAMVVPRDEQRSPALTFTTEQPATTTQGENINAGGSFQIDQVLIPIHTAPPAATTFSAANITLLQEVTDGVNNLDSVAPSSIIDAWQDTFLSSGDRPPQWEAGGSHCLPLVQNLLPSNGKRSKIPFTKGKPSFTILAGTLAITSYRYMLRQAWSIDRNTAAAAFGTVGVPVSAAALISKTVSKTANNVPLSTSLLPWKIPQVAPTASAAPAGA